MGERPGTQFPVGGQLILYVHIAEEGTVGSVIIAISEITVDAQPVHRMYLELCLIFL